MQATNLEEVLALLGQVVQDYRRRRTPLAFFPAVYRATTARVLAGVRSGAFVDPARMDRLATTFANRYLITLTPGAAKPARAWRAALDVERRRHTMILQHILLGMNAHINFDLPLAVLDVAGGGALGALEGDFLEINRILAALLEPVQDVIDAFSPLLHVLDHVGGRTDEEIVTFSLTNARDEAWHEATRLATESSEQRQRSVLSLDRRVALLGNRVIVPDGAIGAACSLIARTESDDVVAIADALLALV
jgi:Family of unknown function (DUF5995)